MNPKIKGILKSLLAFFGLRVHRVDPRQVSDANRQKWLLDIGINTVIDIGASKGNSAMQFRQLFPRADIFAFEPLEDCFQRMKKKVEGMPGFYLFNTALGSSAREGVIHRSSYSGSSSLREMADAHKIIFPVTAGSKDCNVSIDTLDHALEGYALKDAILVKIDVQGAEDEVIAGGLKTLTRAKVVIIETSFLELYVGQPLFDSIYQSLRALGFRYCGAWESDLKSPIDGRSTQQDSIFMRP